LSYLEKRPCQNRLSGNSSLDKFSYRTDCQPKCSAEKNLLFLQLLFSQFRTEMIYVGVIPTGGIKSGRRQVAAWKFDHLDANNDGVGLGLPILRLNF
jgi:hypothetical protein